MRRLQAVRMHLLTQINSVGVPPDENYFQIQRRQLHSMMMLFDVPCPCACRRPTTIESIKHDMAHRQRKAMQDVRM